MENRSDKKAPMIGSIVLMLIGFLLPMISVALISNFEYRALGVGVGVLILFVMVADKTVTLADSERLNVSIIETYRKGLRKLEGQVAELKLQRNASYRERNILAGLLVKLLPGSGTGIDPAIPEGKNYRHVVFLELPAGQVSFHCRDADFQLLKHLPAYGRPFDGHSKIQAIERLHDALKSDLVTGVVDTTVKVTQPEEIDKRGFTEEILNILRDEFIHTPSHVTQPELRLERALARTRSLLFEEQA